jgi:hypothetical protein
MKRLCFVMAVIIGLAGPLAAAQTRPARDEQLARRLLFCMNVNEFFYQYLLQNDPQNAGLAGFRDSRIHFRLAATLLSDGEFVTQEDESAQQEVIRILEKDKAENTSHIQEEARSCAVTFKSEVLPLVEQGGPKK